VIKNELLQRANDLRLDRTPFVLATVVRVERPTSAKAGDCALVLPDGTIEGFVGGACAESTVRLQGMRQLAAGQSMLLRITPTLPPASEPGFPAESAEGLVTVGNPCLSGGTLDIFLEVMRPPMLVHVFGDSPVSRALTELGKPMGWDMRPTTDTREPILADATAVVVASHGVDEEPVLTAALRADVPYVGLVASRRRGRAVLSSLDVAPAQKERVHTPAGLDIHARGPHEIALSIIAEIIASRPAGPEPAGDGGAAGGAAGVEASVPGGAETMAAVGAPAVAPVVAAADPVCGMAVAVTASSVHAEHAGRMWYFCGSGCRDAFAADPERYSA
jgi:xanthine dehydrogenase accessory factor